MGTIPRFNNELSRWRNSVRWWGGEYKSSGRPLLSQIISEHLVIVAPRGSKITFLPTLRTSNFLSSNIPHVQRAKSRPREYCYLIHSQNALGNGGRRVLWLGGGKKDPSSCPV